MPKPIINTVEQKIFWSYANLAMAHSAVEKQQTKYKPLNYMIRAKLFKGLSNGTMAMCSIFDDEKIKLQTGQVCNYCGSNEQLSLDHIFSKKVGGKDKAENLILACRTCNSSKGDKDLLEWVNFKNLNLPLMVIRRYLKLTFDYCDKHNLLKTSMEELSEINLPFSIENLPEKFSQPSTLILNVEQK